MEQWLVIGLESEVFWPTQETNVSFQGHTFLLRPATEEHAPSIAYNYDDSTMEYNDALLVTRRFMSSLSWVEGRSLHEIMITGGSFPIYVGRRRFNLVNDRFRIDYLPEALEPKAQLALALYREALNVNSTSYKVLGFFKILNINYSNSYKQKKWINQTLPLLDGYEAEKRVIELQNEHIDLGEYLYASCRCAVAHAFNEPIADPDDPEDLTRLNADLPLIRDLAVYMIENEFGVKSKQTNQSEHLFQLEGFRSLVGADLHSKLKAKENILLGNFPPFPEISLRLRDHDSFPALENLVVKPVLIFQGSVLLLCASVDSLVQVSLILDFPRERLLFDPEELLVLKDDGSEIALKYQIDKFSFFREFLQNGVLEVWDTSNNVLLGRCDPYIPKNINFDESINSINQNIESLQKSISKRKE